MKIRNGFVSNSSSSSFICDVCGNDASGWDIGLADAEMYECENGHIFCEYHAKINEIPGKELLLRIIKEQEEQMTQYAEKYPDKEYYNNRANEEKEAYKKYLTSDIDDDECMQILFDEYELRYSMPASCCPICSMDTLMSEDIVGYVFKKYGLKHEDLKQEIQEKFETYSDFKQYMK